MEMQDVQLVGLRPMRVASVHGFGASPEGIAADKLAAWAGARGLLDGAHRIFGFNNPSPSPGSPNYGYELWIEVGPAVAADAEAEIRTFDGGRYGVMRCRGVGNIEASWARLNTWRESAGYRLGRHQWLEEHIGPFPAAPDDLTLDLYIPLAE